MHGQLNGWILLLCKNFIDNSIYYACKHAKFGLDCQSSYTLYIYCGSMSVDSQLWGTLTKVYKNQYNKSVVKYLKHCLYSLPKADNTTPPSNIMVHCKTSVYVTASRPPEKNEMMCKIHISSWLYYAQTLHRERSIRFLQYVD